MLKGKAPVSNDVLKVTLPKPQEADLSNGLHLMVLEDHRLPQITFQIIIPGAGGYFDPPAMIGLAGYTAPMMREGTTTKTSQQISQELETMAAHGERRQRHVGAVRDGSRRRADRELRRGCSSSTADVLLNPSLPADGVGAATRRAPRAGLIQQRTQPGFLVGGAVLEGGLRRSPGGPRVADRRETLDAITRDAMVEFHRTQLRARSRAHRLCRRHLAGRGAQAGRGRSSAPGRSRARRSRRPRSRRRRSGEGLPRRAAQLGADEPAWSARSRWCAQIRDYVPLTVANRVLGGTMGRLFRHLREEKGYTYGIGSGFSATDIRGQWTASTNVRTDVTEPALTDLLAEIAEMRDKPVPENELMDAKRAIVAQLRAVAREPAQVLGYYVAELAATGCRRTTGTRIRRRSAP